MIKMEVEMDKIIIAMKDFDYGRNIYRYLLDSLTSSIQLELIEVKDINPVQKDALYLVDYQQDYLEDYLFFSSDSKTSGIYKYQKVGDILGTIEEYISTNNQVGKSYSIALINFNFSTSSLAINQQIAQKLSKKSKCLLVNMNEYHSYGQKPEEIGFEDLILAEKMKSKVSITDLVNKGENFSYINSCIDPFEMKKLSSLEFSNLLKKVIDSSFTYILFEVNFSVSSQVLQLIKLVDKIVFYNSNQSFNDEKYLNYLLDDLIKKNYLSDNFELFQLTSSSINSEQPSIHDEGIGEQVIDFIEL